MACASDDSDSDEVVAGVLLVHGIGQQRPGETLSQACDALVSWFGEWTGNAFRRNLEWDPDPSALVDQANFAPADGAAPANARLIVRLPGKAGAVRLLVAESRWADSFRAPSFGEVVTWGLVVTPWAIMSHFGKRVALAAVGILERERSRRSVALPVVGALLEIIVLTLSLLAVAPILVLYELALLALGLVPISWVRSFVVRQQRLLTATVGDSAVFLRSPTQEAAIVGKVQRDLTWLIERLRGRPVLVIAHSQGAAVSHEALRRSTPNEVSGFVTFGSGLSVLSELKAGYGTAALIPYLALCGGGLAILWAVFGMSEPAAPFAEIWFGLGPLLAVLLLVAMFAPVLENYLREGVLFRGEETGEGKTSWELSSSASRLQKAGFVGWLGILLATYATFPWGLLIIPAWILMQAGLTHPAKYIWIRDWLLSKRELPGAFQWSDYFASCDPVSNGPFRDLKGDLKDRHKLTNRRYPHSSIEVHNRGSWLFDHVLYWKNSDEFLTAIAQEIARVGKCNLDLLVGDRHWIEVSRKRREWRVTWLIAARIAMWIFALAALLPSQGAARVAGYLGGLVSHVTARGTELATSLHLLGEREGERLVGLQTSWGALTTGQALVLVILVIFGAYGIVWVSWLCWNQSEIACFFKRGARRKRWSGYTLFPPWFIVFLVILTTFALGGLYVIAGAHFGFSFSRTAVAVVLAVLGAGLVLFWRPLARRIRAASCWGPLPIAFASTSGLERKETEAAFRARADEIISETERLLRVAADTGKRADLTEYARKTRLGLLGEQWQALADETAILLHRSDNEPTKTYLLRATEALLNSVGSIDVPEDRLKHFRDRLQAIQSSLAQ
jgi:hypothetical protein